MCMTCHKKFPSQSSLAMHWRIHTGEKPFQCGVCSMAFSQKGNLKKHMLIVHDQQNLLVRKYQRGKKIKKPKRKVVLKFFCDACDKGFPSQSLLSIHFRVHTGEKPYECIYCQKTFTQKGNLKGHLAKHHPSSDLML